MNVKMNMSHCWRAKEDDRAEVAFPIFGVFLSDIRRLESKPGSSWIWSAMTSIGKNDSTWFAGVCGFGLLLNLLLTSVQSAWH